MCMIRMELSLRNWTFQLSNMCVETDDTDAQLAIQEVTPLAITQVNAGTPAEKCMAKLPVKISEDDITVTTPLRKSIDIILTEKVPKRKIVFNNIADNGTKSRKDQGDYVVSMLTNSKMLKDEENMRRMEMAEEEPSKWKCKDNN